MSQLVGVPAPELIESLERAGGGVSLAAMRGRIVLLAFWSAGAVESARMLRDLGGIAGRLAADVTLIAVHVPQLPHERRPEAMTRAARRLELTCAVVHDADARTAAAYGVSETPALVLVDPLGTVALALDGVEGVERVESAVDTLVRAHAASGTLTPGPAQVPALGAEPMTGLLSLPSALAWDEATGNFAVSDTGHDRVLLVRPDGSLADIVGSGRPGDASGPYDEACFRRPAGICFWRGALWVADQGNDLLRRVDLEQRSVETVPTLLRAPSAVAPHAGILTVAMAGSHQLWGYDAVSGSFAAVAGSGRRGIADGPAAQAELSQPTALASSDRFLAFVDAASSSLRVVARRPMGGHAIATVIGNLGEFGDADGPSTHARLQHPQGVVAIEGGFAVADTYNHRLRRFTWDTGEVTTIAGGSEPGHLDGDGASSRFDEPSGLVYAHGTLYVADTGNDAIRRIDMATGRVETVRIAQA